NVPNGVQSLKPEDVTPEATADRIVTGITASFDAFAAQNKGLQGEDLLSAFMEKVRSGVDSGYGDAFKTLQDLGAFQYDGVQSGIEKTRSLIDQKLADFEAQRRKDLGLPPKDGQAADQSTSESVKTNVLEQAGGTVNTVV